MTTTQMAHMNGTEQFVLPVSFCLS